jgi:secondary thiamine-phosphate synthase enzyme
VFAFSVAQTAGSAKGLFSSCAALEAELKWKTVGDKYVITVRYKRKEPAMKTFDVQTSAHTQFVNITDQVQQTVQALGITDGVITVFVPHTTCAVTINENEDPHVVEDILRQLETLAPWKNPAYTHAGGNTAAHMKTSLIGSSAQVIVAYGNVQLGMWQGLYLCEFDGPRIRHVWVQ